MTKLNPRQSERETERVRQHVSRLHEVAYDLRRIGHPLSADRIIATALELRDVAREIDRRVGRL